MKRATRLGLIAGPVALLLWPAYAIAQGAVLPFFVTALAITALCGASILIMTGADLLTVQRSRAILPARVFDLALGALLALPSIAALAELI